MRPLYVSFACRGCGGVRGNPAAVHPSDGFANLINASEPELCDACRINGCRCHTWPRHRLMADGHRPDCMARR